MDILEVSWSRAAQVWWSMAWRTFLFTAIAGALAGGVVGAIMGVLGYTENMELIGQIIGVMVAIPVGIWVVKKVLSMEFRKFRIVLLPSHEVVLERALDDAGR